jgi:hypothetical protein
VLQKSKVATQQIFRENTIPDTIADSGTLNRVAEFACGFDARGCVPSRLYTKAAPIARRIFDHQGKGTFATVSPESDRPVGGTEFLRFVPIADLIHGNRRVSSRL